MSCSKSGTIMMDKGAAAANAPGNVGMVLPSGRSQLDPLTGCSLIFFQVF